MAHQAPGAVGWQESTAGIAADDDWVGVSRFESPRSLIGDVSWYDLSDPWLASP
ncbi:MAG: hypothetical protein ACRDYA_12530 [Egibacteraceae bacterium]